MLRFIAVGIGLALLISCQANRAIIINNNELSRHVVAGEPPQSIAVLPFKNNTDTEGIAELARNGIYGHLSVLPYRDVEISIVDRRLRKHKISDIETLRQTPIQKLGRILGCDAILFGQVNNFQRIFAGIYSQMTVSASIQIWDTRSAKKIWSDQHIARIHEGGVPLNILLLPLVSLRTGWNMREEVKIQVIDELTQHLANAIPSPQTIHDATYQYELQLGAFLQEKRAQSFVQQIKDKGYQPFIRNNRDDRGLWYRVLIGPYYDRDKVMQLRHKIKKNIGVDSFVCNVVLKSRNTQGVSPNNLPD
ncbi:DUF799 family lipoprotein [Desulfococcaceae bacterium HSG9]|nr:DUF799 family lipoprotein [Desulfococcaceae bacterium HSG9]